MRLLARREYSRRELQSRLLSMGGDDADVTNLLDEFEAEGWLSEPRLVDAVVQTRRRRFGAAKVIGELREKGVSEAGLQRAREAMTEGEVDAAREVWQKKFGSKPVSLAERARQTRFLAGRGFSTDAIRNVLGQDDE
jgi:regulatory protein